MKKKQMLIVVLQDFHRKKMNFKANGVTQNRKEGI
jgi:hypothetical protein